MTLLKETQTKNKEFFNALEFIRDHPLSEKQELGSFLILPVQRIPRYVLLLTDLINSTDKNHEDYANLTGSLDLMKIVAEQLDDAIQDQDNRNKCYEIQKELGNSFQIVEAHRRFIFEGELIKQCRKERKNRKFWIFNDIIIYGFYQPAILRYVLSRKLEMSALVISDIPDDPQNKIVNAIELNESSKSFLVFCKTFEDKVNWLVMLQNAIIENKQKKEYFLQDHGGRG